MAGTPFTFSDGQAIIGTLANIVDAAGQPTTFKAPPSWTTSDTTILSLTAAADGLSATGTVAKTGTVTVTVAGDGVTQSATINVVAGQVASFAIQFAPAPPPAPPAA